MMLLLHASCMLTTTCRNNIHFICCDTSSPHRVCLERENILVHAETCETESIFNETRIEQEQTTLITTLRQTDMTTQNVSTQQTTTGNATVQSTTEGIRKRTSLVGDLTSTSLPTTNIVVESTGNEGTTPTVVGRTMINRPHYQEKERKNNTRGKVAAVIEGDRPENSGDVSDDRKSAGLDIPLVVGLGSALTVVVLVGSIAFVILRHVAENARSVSPQKKTGEEQVGLMLEMVGTESTSENTRCLQPAH